MHDQGFIAGIRKEVIDSNLETYKELFGQTSPEAATDPLWQTALRFFRALDETQREALFRIIRQLMVDTVSNVLAILDGVSWLEGQEGDFELLLAGENIAGSLQDQFLAAEEEEAE